MAILPERDKYKILLIEDNFIDRKLIHEFIEQTKFTEFELKDTDRLSSGLQLLADESFDAVLLDLFLPDARKLEALDKIIDCKADIPIVILTGLGDEELGISAVRGGAQDYLVKGDFERSLLIRSITYAIERKRAEIALVESEKKYRMLFESSGEGRMITDPTGMILDANPAAAAILGYKSPEELKKIRMTELYMYPEQRKEIFENLVKRGSIEGIEMIGKKKDGMPFHTLATMIAQKDEEGEILKVDIGFRDITARKRAEEALQQKTHDLEQRIKEINCLYGVSQLTRDPQRPIDDVLQQVTSLVPQAWQYPSITCAKITLDEKTYMTDNFQETRWKQIVNIIVSVKKIGTVEVCYLKDMPVIFEGPFLKEERDLIDSLARELGNFYERHNMQNELIDSEVRFRQLVNEVRDIIFTVALNGTITSVNPAFEVLTGWPQDKVIDKPFTMLVHNEDLPIVIEGFESLSKGENPANFDVRIKTKSGKYLVIEGRIEPQFKQGKLFGYLGSAHDITERKQMEENLKKAKKRLEYLFTSNPAVIYASEPKGKYQTIYMSSNVKEITGYESQDFVGKHDFWVEGLHPKDRLRVQNAYQENIIETGHFNEVYRFRHKDGTYRWVLEEAKLITDDQGNPQEIIGYWTDITKLKKIEEALQKSEEKYRTLFQKSTDAIFLVELSNNNIPGRFIEVNDKARRNLGYSDEEFHKMSPKEIVDQELHYKIPKILEEFSKKGHISVELIFASKNNQKTPVEVNSHLVTIKGDKSMLIVARDITKRKETMTTLRVSEKKFRDLISNLSDIVVESDTEGKITFVSPQIFAILGYTPEEVIGKTGLENIHPDDIERALEALNGVLDGDQISHFEVRIKHKEGTSYIPFSISGKAVRENDGLKLVTVFRDITERKQAEETLRESEEKYRNLLNNLTDTVVELDSEGNFTFISPQVFELTGYKPDELNGTNSLEFIHPDDIETVNDVLTKVLEGESVFNYECRGKHKDGYYIWLSISSRVVEAADSSNIVSIIQDITERKQIEIALRESEVRFRQLVETSPDGIVLTDLLGDITLINKQGAINLGYKDEHDLITTNIFELIAPEDQEIALRTIKETLKTGGGIKLEYNFIKKDGTRIPVEMNTTVIKDTTEGKRYFMATIRDITERKEAIRLLQESEKKYRTILTSIEDSYYETDLAGNFTFFNDQLCNLLECSRNELTGTNYKQFGDDTTAQRVYQIFNTVFRTRKPTKGFEWEVLSKDGTKKYVDVSVSLITDSSGESVGFRGIARDATERKEAQETLRQSEERLKQAQQVAHLGFWDWNIITGDLYWSDEAFQMFGIDPQEYSMTYNKVMSLIHPEDIKMLEEHINAALNDDAEYNVEVRGLLPSGEIRYFQGQGKAIRDTNGKAIRFIGTQLDITDRKRFEETLKKSEERFRKIFTDAPIGMTLNDLDYHFISVNENFCQILGYTMQELTKLTFKDVTHPDHIKRDIEHAKKLATKEIGLYKTEKRYIKKNKEIFWARTTVTLLLDEKDEPHCYLAMIEDIGQEKQVEEEIRKQLMKFKIENGNIYLIPESSPTLSKQVFNDLIQVGYSGRAISRIPEKEFKKEVDQEFQFLWFSETREKNSLPPQLKEIEKIIDGMQAKSVIWIDRLDYLISKNGFKETLKSVFKMREIAYLNDLVVILSVDPETLSKQHIRSLKKETKTVEPRFLVRVPDEMLEVLRIVFQQNNLGVKPSFTDIGNELEISKPTTRKRIKELVATGYLNEQKSGNRKILELTEKGLMVFKK